jgi:hypothetical protein
MPETASAAVVSVDRIIFSIFNGFNEKWKNCTLRLFRQAA